MLDERKYNGIVKKHVGLVRSLCAAYGFEDDELDEMVQQVWLNLWKSRANARELKNEVAYLAGIARKTCQMALRKEGRKKREGREYRFEERDTGEITSGTINGAQAFKSADQERLVDRKHLRENLVAIAATMKPAHERVFLARLANDPDERPELREAATTIGALRHSRRLLDLPPDSPQRNEVTDPAAHVARVVRILQRTNGRPAVNTITRPNRQENACAAGSNPTTLRESERTLVTPPNVHDWTTESSAPSFSMTARRPHTKIALSQTFGRKRSSKSTQPKSACERSPRRDGPAASPTATIKISSIVRRPDRRSCPSTERPTAMSPKRSCRALIDRSAR